MKRKKSSVLCSVFLVSFAAFASDLDSIQSVTVIYDSGRHYLSGLEQNFPIQKYDVALTSTIEAEISKRLVYPNKARSVEEVEAWARSKVQKDPELRSLFDQLNSSFDYLSPSVQFGIDRVPAVITHINGEHFVVYGQTSIQFAVEEVLRYRSRGR